MPRRPFSAILCIFTISGFSGLIYKSLRTHYLKLFLGHEAYAQTLVLAIFMGGMAFGSWLCNRYSVRWNSLLIGYALTEGVKYGRVPPRSKSGLQSSGKSFMIAGQNRIQSTGLASSPIRQWT